MWIVSVPLEIRLAIVFVAGLAAGSLINWAAYTLAWNPRPISPWGPAHEKILVRSWRDRLPVFGWLRLRRETPIHGSHFWLRPLLVELTCGFGFAWLYWWEVYRLGLLQGQLPPGGGVLAPPGPVGVLHAQFLSHLLLITLMFAGSLIDADEKIIPDTITVPGTWLGLLLAAAFPWSLLPFIVGGPGGPIGLNFVHAAAPQPLPLSLKGFPHGTGLVVGLGCWWLWCVALMHRTWYARRGWIRALRLTVARLVRDPSTPRIAIMGLIGSAVLVGVWVVGGLHWAGLVTALVGMAASGGIIWVVRVVGTAALGREAMGFGDVTLMAMIGTFLGWQACLMVFFLAPFAGLVVGLAMLVLRRENEIPYGPFLCLAATLVIVRWAALWNWAIGVFALGWLIPAVLLVCLVLMALMLAVWQKIRAALG